MTKSRPRKKNKIAKAIFYFVLTFYQHLENQSL